jgi:hypothetical protein
MAQIYTDVCFVWLIHLPQMAQMCALFGLSIYGRFLKIVGHRWFFTRVSPFVSRALICVHLGKSVAKPFVSSALICGHMCHLWPYLLFPGL